MAIATTISSAMQKPPRQAGRIQGLRRVQRSWMLAQPIAMAMAVSKSREPSPLRRWTRVASAFNRSRSSDDLPCEYGQESRSVHPRRTRVRRLKPGRSSCPAYALTHAAPPAISVEFEHRRAARSRLVVDEPFLGQLVERAVGLQRGDPGIDRRDQVRALREDEAELFGLQRLADQLQLAAGTVARCDFPAALSVSTRSTSPACSAATVAAKVSNSLMRGFCSLPSSML